MASRPTTPLLGWTAAVTVPLLILAILATLGLRSQKMTARSRVQEEAAAISASQARLLSEQLKAAIEEFPKVSDAPVPGRASSLDEILDGTDLRALTQLRDNPDAGFSPAGLPRRALAALRLEFLAPGMQEPDELAKLLTVEAPSILTLPALKRLKNKHPELEFSEVWKLIDHLDEFRSANPDGGWIRFEDQPWWISAGGERFLPPTALTTATLELPAFATARFSSNREPLTGPADGEVLASSPVDFPSQLALDWILTSPEVIATSSRQQSRWTFALLATSLAVSVLGLYAILRMVREERRLGVMKSQFVASVSHELRAPIGSIRLMADSLAAGRVDDPAEFHQLIGRESERLSQLIENVLDFARIEEGERHYHLEESDLTAVIGDVVELFSARAADSGHAIKLSLEKGTAFIDRTAIQQALANLLDNALKFSPPGTAISVNLSWQESSWSLAVIDEGPGVPEAESRRIFERFYRLGDELRRETKGTGIGLSIVQHIAEAHGGSVQATNHPSTFTFTAPIHPHAAP
jgi:signal transduction histidine kinase